MRGSTVTCLWIIAAALSPARASDYGCTVLLCLSNPNGPQAVAECVSPIEQLKRDLRNRKPFPECEEADGKAYARPAPASPYDACPAGTSALPSGEFAQMNTDPGTGTTLMAGIGEGNDQTPGEYGIAGLPNKICVGPRMSTIKASVALSAESSQNVTAGIYERLVLMPPGALSGAIEIVVDGHVYRRARY